MKRRYVIAAALVLSLAGWPLLAQGQGQGPGGGVGPSGGQRMGGPGRGGPGGPMAIFPGLNEVGLTEAQHQQIRALMEQERQSGNQAAKGRQAEQALHAAVLADAPDGQAIEAAKIALNTARTSELDHRIELMEKVAQILTPAQRQQLAEMGPGGPRGRGPSGR